MTRDGGTGATRASGLGAVADRAWQRLQIDRFAGGRQRAYVIQEDMRQHPRTVVAFQRLRWLLVALTVVSTGAVVVALALSDAGHVVPLAVWVRCAAVLGITLTLYVFAWRAQLGWWWAYSRLRLFSRIFPVVTLVVASIPGLYPAWMVLEQIVFSFLLVGISAVLGSNHMRGAFPKPEPGVVPVSATERERVRPG